MIPLLTWTLSEILNALKLIGKVTADDVRTTNGPKGEQWVSAVDNITDHVETQLEHDQECDFMDLLTFFSAKMWPNMISSELGAKAHKSSKDPEDPAPVLTLGFYSKKGIRLLSGHVQEDGSYKLAESRAGKGRGKRK
ncbi:hypothetical protein ACJ72_05621 [Emergomyces africanus]|uniref:Uncharacterized protein n=1 Tax=Emergomyces africanus TaxID=1955775 RepID=A0A1B7NTH6_9EURO|nr:hypothetical protein ACJ72_05621 [Emergomyces africanus]